MEKQNHSNEIDSKNELNKSESNCLDNQKPSPVKQIDSKSLQKTVNPVKQDQSITVPKKPVKPPKLEDKPFDEFINLHLIPGLKSAIEEKGTLVTDIKLIEGKRPVVGGYCWMVFCEISDQRDLSERFIYLINRIINNKKIFKIHRY